MQNTRLHNNNNNNNDDDDDDDDDDIHTRLAPRLERLGRGGRGGGGISNHEDNMGTRRNMLPSRLVVIVGTYDGVLAGWDTAPPTIVLPPSSSPGGENANENDDGESSHESHRTNEIGIESRLLRNKNDGKYLKMTFATAAHEGSVRCIDVASATPPSSSSSSSTDVIGPGMLLSGGYDESINVYDLSKRAQSGELRTPNDLGSPSCCAFAPPSNRRVVVDDVDGGGGGDDAQVGGSTNTTTHAIVGTSTGKVIIYKRGDWSVQHVSSGHDSHGVNCVAVHPTGRMALTGGTGDGRLILWDLVKGRLAYVHRIKPTRRRGVNTKRIESINHIVWSGDGTRYAYCHGSKIVARDATTGEDLLDVDMSPNCTKVNMVAFVGGDEGMFLAAACDDGGLPVLEVGRLFDDDDDDKGEDDDDYGDDDEDHDDDYDDGEDGKKAATTRRAIMAIEPVDGPVAGDDRFKCIRSVEGGSGFLVVTANSGGVVSLMDLEGAVRMMLTPDRYNDDDDDDDDDDGAGKKSSTSNRGRDDDDDDDDDDEDQSDDDQSDSSSSNEEVEVAVEILDSVRVGSGARITDLAVWSYGGKRNYDRALDFVDSKEGGSDTSSDDGDDSSEDEEGEPSGVIVATSVEGEGGAGGNKRKPQHPPTTRGRGGYNKRANDRIELDPEAVEKARKLVGQAKEHEKRKRRKLSKKS
ncbi:hypothetical protein ACHAXA_008428 [Cyclostephanos tholiformis]|uniref:Uncharacterized protein n=1 Tax=Cyclostephanos tholiformis TaxID=382380 RepID=A0ABD3SBN2_9STRA